MIFSVWTGWIRAKGKEMKNREKNGSNDISRNEISGHNIKRNESSGGYGAVNISTSTSTSISGITELLISVKKNLYRVF